jgi:hypothetical protein
VLVVDGRGALLGAHLASASEAQVALLEPTIERVAVPRAGPGRSPKKPERLVVDEGYDSDAPRAG